MAAIRIYVTVAALVILLLAPQSFCQEEMRFVDNSVFRRPVRPPAIFEHDVHNETAEIDDCALCHHLFENGQRVEGETSEDQACSECHLENDSESSPSLRRAYHLNCKGCHMELGAGPIMCAQCHQTKVSAED